MWILRISLFIGLVGVLALAADEADYEYEDAPEPVAPKKPALPTRGIRPGLSIPGKNNKIPNTPVKAPTRKGAAAAPPPPPVEPEEGPLEEYDEEEQPAEAPAEEASTEPPKKTIKPVVRPFRSNDDLLAALKRRRQQAQEKGTVVDKTTQSPLFSTEAPKKQTVNLNKRPRVPPKPSEYSAENSNRKPPSQGRKPTSRGAKQIEEEQPEVEATLPPPSRNKFSRGSRRQ